MSREDTLENGRMESVRLEVDNLGGISDAELTLSEGVTLVSGANASNKSSLLRSLVGVLGGPRPPLKSDADAGAVRLTTNGTEYHVELSRNRGDVVVTGSERYSQKSDLCELFVALTEENPIRRAVLADGDLYDLLMRPVETGRIQAEIQRLMSEKRSIDERLDEIDAREDRLPGLRARRDGLQEELADIEESLREKRDAVEGIERESGVAEGSPSRELEDRRTERTEIENRIGTHEDAIESLETELDDIDGQLDQMALEGSDADPEQIEDDLERLHRRKQQLTSTINALSPVVEMNSKLLDGADEVPDPMTSADVVAELDPSSRTITCWTCGSTVERAQIVEQVEAVREIVKEKRNERDAVTERIQSLTERKRELERRREELDRLRTRRSQIVDEIEGRESKLVELREERQSLEAEIEELRGQVEAASDEAERLSAYYDDISDLEYERGRVTNDIEEVEAEISDIEADLADRPEIEDRRESVAEELRERRERIDSIEGNLVTTFNEVMQRVLDTLAYRSIERVWLERVTTGDRQSPETEFELHVVRTSDDGTAYDDSVDNLSKSEREVIGLVVGLAGYLVHDVADEVPFLVIDAVEMFDAERLRGLVEHFGDHADYVVAAVLPEEGAQLEGTYDTIAMSPSAAD